MLLRCHIRKGPLPSDRANCAMTARSIDRAGPNSRTRSRRFAGCLPSLLESGRRATASTTRIDGIADGSIVLGLTEPVGSGDRSVAGGGAVAPLPAMSPRGPSALPRSEDLHSHRGADRLPFPVAQGRDRGQAHVRIASTVTSRVRACCPDDLRGHGQPDASRRPADVAKSQFSHRTESPVTHLHVAREPDVVVAVAQREHPYRHGRCKPGVLGRPDPDRATRAGVRMGRARKRRRGSEPERESCAGDHRPAGGCDALSLHARRTRPRGERCG